MLLPGVARAEGDDSEDVTLSLVDADPSGESGEGACNLFDGNTSTDWQFSFSSRAYVIFKASKAIVVDGYTITSSAWSSYYSGSTNPKSWTLSGSNDLKNWTVIGQVSNDCTLQAKNSTTSDFDCSSNDAFYKFFKWEITEVRSFVRISEFSLKQKTITCSGHQIEKVEAKTATCVDMGNAEYYKCSICQQAFKDEAGTDAYTDDGYILAAIGHNWQGDKCSTCGIGALKYTETEGGVAITGFEKGYSTSQLVIPAMHDGKPVVAIGTSAFFYKASIESVEIPSSVKTIGDFAFSKCTPLSAVTFVPDSKLETIGKSAFSNTNLSNIEIPSSVTEIGDESFLNCGKLASVTFSSDSKLEVIGKEAFMNTKLLQIVILSSVKEIGELAFANCSKLSSVTFSADGKLETIGSYSFYGDDNLSSIEIPASVVTIEERAFSDVYLSSLKFAADAKLKTIGEGAFAYNYISSVVLPASLESMENNLFESCDLLNYITLKRSPKSVDEILGYNCNLLDANEDVKLYVSKECADFYREVLPNYADRILGTFQSYGYIYGESSAKDGLTCLGFSGDSPSNYDIPYMINGSRVIAIGNGAFQNTSISSIEIPASVQSIGVSAFYGCSKLTSVVFVEGSQLNSIGSNAFYNSSITGIELPSSVTTIGFHAFGCCSSLTSVTFGRIPIADNSISGYSNDMLYSCDKITSVNVPCGCENVYKTQLNLGDNVTITGLDIVENGLKFAVNAAMDGLVCTGFSGDVKQDVVIPETAQGLPVTGIGESAFKDKTLTSVAIPAFIEEIGSMAFAFTRLNSVSFVEEGKLKTIGEDAFSHSLISSISIPASVEEIGDGVFCNCLFLSSVSFSRNGQLRTIGNGAFTETFLSRVSAGFCLCQQRHPQLHNVFHLGGYKLPCFLCITFDLKCEDRTAAVREVFLVKFLLAWICMNPGALVLMVELYAKRLEPPIWSLPILPY